MVSLSQIPHLKTVQRRMDVIHKKHLEQDLAHECSVMLAGFVLITIIITAFIVITIIRDCNPVSFLLDPQC